MRGGGEIALTPHKMSRSDGLRLSPAWDGSEAALIGSMSLETVWFNILQGEREGEVTLEVLRQMLR